jgi:hypothetical protein
MSVSLRVLYGGGGFSHTTAPSWSLVLPPSAWCTCVDNPTTKELLARVGRSHCQEWGHCCSRENTFRKQRWVRRCKGTTPLEVDLTWRQQVFPLEEGVLLHLAINITSCLCQPGHGLHCRPSTDVGRRHAIGGCRPGKWHLPHSPTAAVNLALPDRSCWSLWMHLPPLAAWSPLSPLLPYMLPL